MKISGYSENFQNQNPLSSLTIFHFHLPFFIFNNLSNSLFSVSKERSFFGRYDIKMSRRSVGFSPDFYVDKARASHKHDTKAGGSKRRVIGIWSFRLPKSSSFLPVGFLRRVGAKVAMALRFRAVRRSSRKVSSSSSLARSRSYAETIDSHRAEAIDDCIEFLKYSSSSSSSLQRSNSVPASHC